MASRLPPPSVPRGHRDVARYAPIRFEVAVRTISAPAVEGIVHSLLRRRRTQRHITNGSRTPPPSLHRRFSTANIESVAARTRNATRRADILAQAESHARHVQE